MTIAIFQWLFSSAGAFGKACARLVEVLSTGCIRFCRLAVYCWRSLSRLAVCFPGCRTIRFGHGGFAGHRTAVGRRNGWLADAVSWFCRFRLDAIKGASSNWDRLVLSGIEGYSCRRSSSGFIGHPSHSSRNETDCYFTSGAVQPVLIATSHQGHNRVGGTWTVGMVLA